MVMLTKPRAGIHCVRSVRTDPAIASGGAIRVRMHPVTQTVSPMASVREIGCRHPDSPVACFACSVLHPNVAAREAAVADEAEHV